VVVPQIPEDQAAPDIGVVTRAEVAAEASTANDKDDKDDNEHSYAIANAPSPAMELSIDDSVNASMHGNTSSGETTQSSKPKKAKLSSEVSIADNSLSSSPDLHYKLPSRSIQESEDNEEGRVHTNMFGTNFVMWFEIGIEGKSPMDDEEDDWGGKLEFGFSENNFPKEIEDYLDKYRDAHISGWREVELTIRLFTAFIMASCSLPLFSFMNYNF
jgi:hypothetical protein